MQITLKTDGMLKPGKITKMCLLYLVIFVFPLTLFSQEATPFPKHYVCNWASTSINIDGLSSDEAWQLATWSSDFVDIEGDNIH